MNVRKKYMNDLKRHLVYIGKPEKKSLQTLNIEIEHFVDENTSYSDLIEQFGEPKTLAGCYIDEYDDAILKKKVKNKKLLIIMCLIILIIVIFIIFLISSNYQNAKDSYITREKEVIIEN